MAESNDTPMTTEGNAGGPGEHSAGPSGGLDGRAPICSQCQGRHRPEVPCWQPCPRCNIRHHRRSACPRTSWQQQSQQQWQQQQQMAELQRQNAQLMAEMQHMRAAQQQRSAFAANYGYSSAPLPTIPLPSYPSYPSYPAGPWQPQPVMPPMAMGPYPYQGTQYQPSLPPPSPYAGGFAVGVPQGMPSDTTSWFGGSSGQASRRGGPLRSNRGRGTKRSEKKSDEKKAKKDEKGEKQKEREKEKERDVLASVPSGVKKAGKNASRNARYRQKRKAKRETKSDDESGEGEEEGMTGVEPTSNPEIQPSGPPQSDSSGQQVAGAGTALATESQILDVLAGAENAGDTSLPSSSHHRVGETQAVGETEYSQTLLQEAFGDLSQNHFDERHSQDE